jgi:hypothetical protein
MRWDSVASITPVVKIDWASSYYLRVPIRISQIAPGRSFKHPLKLINMLWSYLNKLWSYPHYSELPPLSHSPTQLLVLKD